MFLSGVSMATPDTIGGTQAVRAPKTVRLSVTLGDGKMSDAFMTVAEGEVEANARVPVSPSAVARVVRMTILESSGSPSLLLAVKQ